MERLEPAQSGLTEHAMVQAKSPPSAFTATRLLWILVGGLLMIAVLTSLSDFHKVATALSRSDLLLTAVAFGLVGLYSLNLAEFYRSIFRAGGLTAGPLRFVLISSASHFINLVSKTSGFGGLALYLGEARRQGDSVARVGAAYLAAYVLGYVAYLSVLISALVLLYLRGALTTVEITASSIILVIVAAIASLLVIGLRSERALQAMLLLAVGLVNRATRLVGKPALISVASASDSAKELHGSLQAVISRPASYVRPFGHALGRRDAKRLDAVRRCPFARGGHRARGCAGGIRHHASVRDPLGNTRRPGLRRGLADHLPGLVSGCQSPMPSRSRWRIDSSTSGSRWPSAPFASAILKVQNASSTSK